jgi:hypothetical protein
MSTLDVNMCLLTFLVSTYGVDIWFYLDNTMSDPHDLCHQTWCVKVLGGILTLILLKYCFLILSISFRGGVLLQLVDVQIFATARVTLKPLIPIFPCFSKIVVSLMERPYVDFGLKLLGGDLMAIPGVYGFVQDFIKDQVSQLYMWPKTLEIPVIDDPSAAKKPVGILEVTVLRAKNLLKMDVLGKADPYVKFHLVNTLMSKKTHTKMNTLNPEWNETFKLLVQDPKSQSLELHVYDWDRIGTDEEMGMIVVPLQDLVEFEQKTLDLNLLKNDDPNDDRNKKARGVLTVGLLYKSFKEVLQVCSVEDKSTLSSNKVCICAVVENTKINHVQSYWFKFYAHAIIVKFLPTD